MSCFLLSTRGRRVCGRGCGLMSGLQCEFFGHDERGGKEDAED